MRTTEHNAKPASTPKAGLFALLVAFLHLKGTSASKTSQGSGATKTSRRLILSALATTLGALAFTSAPALAAGGGHVFSNSFGETCVVAAGEPCEGKFDDPTGIAVNNATGNVYVVDKGNNRVEEFNPTGTKLEAEFNGSGTAGKLSEPEAIAIDNSGETAAEDPSVGDVYVTDHNVIDKFSSTGEYKGQITTGEGGAPLDEMDGVAVDPKGQLWVYQKNGQIDAFSDAEPNVFVSSITSPATSPPEPGFAVNSEDDLYVAHAEEEVKIAKLNSKGEELESELGGGEGKTGVAVEASSNNVYIDSAYPFSSKTPEIQEFTPGGTEIETFGQKQLAGRGGTALAVSYANVSSGDVYVVDSSAGKVDIFTPPKAVVHTFSSSFMGEGAHALSEPAGIALNAATEDAYVVDKGNKRVEEFAFNTTTKLYEYMGEFSGAQTPAKSFDTPEMIAIDNSGLPPSAGDVYVADNGHDVVDKFSATGAYEGQLAGTCAVENETQFNGTCESGEAVKAFDGIHGVGVDSEGNVWVSTGDGLDEFSDTGGFLKESTGIGEMGFVPGLAVVSNEDVYVNTGGLPPSPPTVVKFDPATGQVLAALSGGDALAIGPSTGDLFVDSGSSIAAYAPVEEPSPSPLDTFSGPGLQESKGVAVNGAGTVYATGKTGIVDLFNEYFLPQVVVGAFTGLTAESVTLEGSVNPEGQEVSSCEFEYGTTTAYGQRATCKPAAVSLGKGTEPVRVSAKLTGLASGTTYHYRLVAGNAHGTHQGTDQVLTTPGPTISEERVSSVEERAATLQVTIDPNGVQTSYHFEYDTSLYTSSAPHGTSVPVPNSSVGSGTSPVPVSVRLSLEPGKAYYYRVVAESELFGKAEKFDGPNKTFTTNPAPGGGRGSETCPNEQRRAEQPFGLTLPDCRAYELVSPEETGGQDATDSFIETNVRAAESSENPAITYASKGSFGSPTGAAREDQFVSRRNAEKERWETQAITPLLNPSKTENFASFEATVFEPELKAGIAATDASLTSEAPKSFSEGFGLYVADFAAGSYRYVASGVEPPLGASTDLSHVVFEGEGDTVPPSETVSEWVNGEVVPVSVMNKGTVIKAAVGSQHTDYANQHEVWHAVSADGSRVYFTSPAKSLEETVSGGAHGALYLRVNAEQKQSELGTNQECIKPTKACTVEVSSAGASGVRYWGASADGAKVFFTKEGNLYQYELPIGATTGTTTAIAGGAEVQGVVQISEEGQYVYFVAKAALKGEHGAALRNISGVQPVAGEENLYVSHEGGAPVFIATLAKGDEPDWHGAGSQSPQGSGPQINTAVVTPNGSRLAFLSERSLTGYDNRQAQHGECEGSIDGTNFDETGECQEVYLYDAETHGLVCASCNPTGARPLGPSGFGKYADESALYRARNLIEDGTLFFDSSDALSPHAKDGRQNVYEYEEGQIHAISNVAGGGESFFLDASASGEDVFFGSADKLLPQDTSDNVVVWDARVDGGFPFPVAAPPCTTAEACRTASPPTPSVFGAPPSATFSGPGNVTPPPPVAKKVTKKTVKCKKGDTKNKKGKCIKKPKKKSKAKRAGHNRRTHS